MHGGAVLDTCCLINFLASGHARSILRSIGGTLYVPAAVRHEIVYVVPDDAPENFNRSEVDAIASELRIVVEAPSSPEETALYVQLAAELDDGEAMAIALAKSKQRVLITDERKARRRATALEIDLKGTVEVLRAWAAESDARDVAEALRRIVSLGRFSPNPRDVADHSWWCANLRRDD